VNRKTFDLRIRQQPPGMNYKNLLFFALIILLASCGGIRDSMTFFPDKTSEIPKEQFPEYHTEKFISTSDGESIQAFYFNHSDSTRHPLVIYFHGNAGNLYGRLGYANTLFNMGQNVLLVSYRGYGHSTGEPSESGIYTDGESAVNYAQTELGYQESEITLLGRSLGTTVAVNTAQNKSFKNVILITPLTSGAEMAEAMDLGSLTSIAGKSYNSLGKINNLRSPLLIVHGDQDEVTPYYMGEELFEAYTGEKKMVTIPGGKHNDLQTINPALFWGSIEQLLKQG